MDAGMEARKAGTWRWAVLFFVVTYLVTGLLWIPILRSGQSLTGLTGRISLFFLLAGVAHSAVAFVLAGIEGGRAALGELLAQGGRRRFGLGWYAIALFLAPLIALLALVIARALGGHPPALGAPLQFLIPIAAVGEEFGWRGYAQPRLQRRMPPLAAALLIGVIWAVWHLPYFAYPAVHPLAFGIGFPLFVAVIVSESVLATWIYNSTHRSVLATMIFHYSITVGSVIPAVPGVLAGVVLAVVNLVAAGAVAASRGSLARGGDQPDPAPYCATSTAVISRESASASSGSPLALLRCVMNGRWLLTIRAGLEQHSRSSIGGYKQL
jgi:uncharacterized protein